MGKLKILIVFFALMALLLTGCTDKSLDYVAVTRDNFNTGGNLSFEYDALSHTAYFGGDGETIEWQQASIVRGFDRAGNRVGVKLVAPSFVSDFSSGSAIVGDEKLEGGEFYQSVDGKTSPTAQFFPLVSEKNRVVTIKVIWQEGIKEQVYTIVIKEGTAFLDE